MALAHVHGFLALNSGWQEGTSGELQSSQLPHAQLPPVFLTSTLVLGQPGLLSQIKRPRTLPVLKPFNSPAQEGGVRAGCRSQTCPGAANRQQPLAAVEQDPALVWHMLPLRLWYHHPKLEQGPHQQGHVVLGEERGRAAAPPSPASFLPVQCRLPSPTAGTGHWHHGPRADLGCLFNVSLQSPAGLKCPAWPT